MIKFCYVTFVFLFMSLFLAGQSENLVLNPGFEEFEECPQSYTRQDMSHKLIPHWTYPTIATPDYFNRCSNNIVDVPGNFAGHAEPNSGNAYMGAILTGSEKNYREYIQGELAQPLEAGKKYCVTYHYRLASYSKFIVDQMSLYFRSEKMENKGKKNIGAKPQINNTAGLFLDNPGKWEQMCYVYTAEGGERFFIIGNFKSYEHTNYVVTDKDMSNKRDKSYAYYYFDDFSVRELNDCEICPCVRHGLETIITDSSYTGGKDPVTGEIDEILNDGRIKIAVNGGEPPYYIEWSNNQNSLELNNLSAGTYSYTVTDRNNCRSTGTVTFIEPEIPEDDFTANLKNIEEGSAIVLENIFFETGKTTLLPVSYEELDKVYHFMEENDIKEIGIAGHTDNKGSEDSNMKLSLGRAQAVVDYLAEKGIETERLSAKGYGETKPIDTNETEAGRAKNRRVEFILIRK